jgi:6-phosphogluconolactonase
VKPGAGPRHFTFHPRAPYAYVINELASTITVFAWDAERGTLKELQTVPTLPDGFSGESFTAEVQVHPSGRYIYGSNRGHDSIAVFVVRSDGTLKPVEHVKTGGQTPRNFGIDPTGSYLFAANQRSDSVTLFRIDGETGRLSQTGTLAVPSPVCVKFLKRN